MNLVNKIKNNKGIVFLFVLLIVVVLTTFLFDSSKFDKNVCWDIVYCCSEVSVLSRSLRSNSWVYLHRNNEYFLCLHSFKGQK